MKNNIDLTLEEKLKKYIKEKCPLAYLLTNHLTVYLLGGAIRNLMYDEKPKDLDFMILGSRYESMIPHMLNIFGIEYKFNRFGGYKFVSNGIEVDLWANDNKNSAIEYNVDGLFFNLNTGKLESLTFDDFIENGLIKINDNNNTDEERVKKLVKFEEKFRKYNK